MKLYKNIDIVQINIKEGVQEYYLPKNVDWANQVIDGIAVYTPYQELGEQSPVDGVSPIVDREIVSSLYFDLYADDGREIAQGLNAQNLLFTNNHPVEINSKISLQLSRIFFATPSPIDGALILYIFYSSEEKDIDIPQRNVTVTFPIKGGEELLLSDVIDTYIHAQCKKLKGVQYWGILTEGVGLFITLRNRNYKTVVNRLSLNMCRPPMGAEYMTTGVWGKAQSVQINPLYLDEDIDFANSTIQNTWGSDIEPSMVTLTFLY